MATEQSTTALGGDEGVAWWSGWVAALAGLWVLVSPFVLAGGLGSGSPRYSNVIAGLVALVLSAYAAYET